MKINRWTLLSISFVLLLSLLAGGACVVGSSHPCKADEDCSDGLQCRRNWCVPTWYELGQTSESTPTEKGKGTDAGSEKPAENPPETRPEPRPDTPAPDVSCTVCVAGTSRPCYPAGTQGCNPDGSGCKGVCKAGVQVCEPSQGRCGVWSTKCVGAVTGSQDLCNNKDDDCDGQIDENLTRPCFDGNTSQRNVGVCKDGTQTCNAGKWGACQGSGKAIAEVCNLKDDDCDGRVDNFPAATTLPILAGIPSSKAGDLLPFVYRAVASDGSFYFAAAFYKAFVWQGKQIKPTAQDLPTLLVGKVSAKRQVVWLHTIGTEYGVSPRAILLTSKGRLFVGGTVGRGTLVTTFKKAPGMAVLGTDNGRTHAFLAELTTDGSELKAFVAADGRKSTTESVVYSLAENSQGQLLVGGLFEGSLTFGQGSQELAGATYDIPFLQQYPANVQFQGPPTWQVALPVQTKGATLFRVLPHPTKNDVWLIGGGHEGSFKVGTSTITPKGPEAGYLGFVSAKDGKLTKLLSVGDPSSNSPGSTVLGDVLSLGGGKLLLLYAYTGDLSVPLSATTLILNGGGVAIVGFDTATEQFTWGNSPTVKASGAFLFRGASLTRINSSTVAVSGLLGSANATWGTSTLKGTTIGLNYWVGFVDTVKQSLTTGFVSDNPRNGYQFFSGVHALSNGLVEVFGAYEKQFGLGKEIVNPPLGLEGGWFWKVLDPRKGWQCQ